MNPRGVEEWLLEIENCMKSTLLDIFGKSKKVYAVAKRKDWLFNWPC